MRRIILIVLFSFSVILSNSFAAMEGHMAGHMTGAQEYGESAGSEAAPYGMMNPGMMGYGGCGMMGPGMMNPGMMGYGGCGMMGPGMMWGYGGKEKYRQFLDETKDLRKQIHMKKFEYFETARKPDADPKKLAEMENEIRELQKKIYEKSEK